MQEFVDYYLAQKDAYVGEDVRRELDSRQPDMEQLEALCIAAAYIVYESDGEDMALEVITEIAESDVVCLTDLVDEEIRYLFGKAYYDLVEDLVTKEEAFDKIREYADTFLGDDIEEAVISICDHLENSGDTMNEILELV